MVQKESTVFDYDCVDCCANSGPTTAALSVELGEPPRHIVSMHVALADVFLPQRKPHKRRDEQVGFTRELIKEFTTHAATQDLRDFRAYV